MRGSARRRRARRPGVSRGRPDTLRHPDPGGPVSCLGLVDLPLDAQVALHHFLEVVAGGLEHLEPAVLPVAHARKPRRAASAGPGLGAATLEMETPVLGERLPEPDVAEARVPGIGEELRCPEGDVLAAQSDAAERVHVEALERPDAGLLARRRQVLVEMLVERLAEGNGGVVVPREELARDDLVHADLLQPEIDSGLELPLGRLLADDRYHHAREDLVLLAQLEGRADVPDVPTPPGLRVARGASPGRAEAGGRFGGAPRPPRLH